MTTARVYDVFVGVCGAANPGRHAVAMVVAAGDRRDEWARALDEPALTTPRAWLLALERALARVNRSESVVTIAVHDQNLARRLAAPDPDADAGAANADVLARVRAALAARPRTAVAWIAKRDGHPDMERAHALAAAALEEPATP